MRTALFHLTLEADVVVTERFAAQSSYDGLPFLPGNLFLGVAASRLYRGLSTVDSFAAFHSGRVRFGTAYPVFDGAPAFPIPFSWFFPKGEKAVLSGEHANVTNLLRRTERGKGEDPKFKQLREGYFTMPGALGKPATGYRLKSAVDRDRGGRPKEGQLFGYEHFVAGSEWWFTVSADDGIDAELFRSVTDALKGRVRIGRSRSAEYGAATVRRVAETMESVPIASLLTTEIVLYCLSDLALVDTKTGIPTINPCRDHFWIPESKSPSFCFDADRSYVRPRVFTTFNARRKAAELERQAIARGSVLVFTTDRPLSEVEIKLLQSKGEAGIGMYRQEGLGRFLVEPAFLASERFAPSRFNVPGLLPTIRRSAVTGGATEFLAWLNEKRGTVGLRRDATAIVDGWIALLLPEVLKHGTDSPSKRQWSRLRDLSSSIDSVGELTREVGSICAQGVREKQWALRFDGGERWLSFAEFLCDSPDKSGARRDCRDDLPLLRASLRQLGERMVHEINQQRTTGESV